jgi:hypothetical protein
VGELRKICEDAIERGELVEREASEYYVSFLRKQGITGVVGARVRAGASIWCSYSYSYSGPEIRIWIRSTSTSTSTR